MKRHEKQFLSLAAFASVCLHVFVIYSVMHLPFALAVEGETGLFTKQQPEPEPMQVFRAPEDLFLEDEPTESVLETLTAPESVSKTVQNDTQELLKELDPGKAIPESEQPKPAEVAAEITSPELAAPTPAAAPKADPARIVDASRKLLSMAEPAVKLPSYQAPTDSVSAPPPSSRPSVDPGEAISGAQLAQLEKMLSAGGSGLVASATPADMELLPAGTPGSPGGMGTGSGNSSGTPGIPMPPPAPKPEVELPDPIAVAPMKLPDPPALELPEPEKQAVHLDQDFDYKLRLYEEPPDRGLFGFGANEPGTPWFEVRITPRRSLHRLKPLNKDVVWVLDTSGSIERGWVDQLKKGVSMAMESLTPGDRFNIVLFKDDVTVLSEDGLLPANPTNYERARKFMNSAESSGYTDVNRALGRLITRGVEPDRVYNIILVSDGVPTRGAVDPRSIINMITRENDLVAGIYCVAVGDRVDRKLLEFLAYRNKGYVVYPESRSDAATAMRELAGQMRYPILKDATFDAVGVDTGAIFPRIPRDIYQGQPFSLYGRRTDGATRLSMRITGTSGPQILDFTFTLPFKDAEPGDETIAREWAFWKLHHLYSEIIRQGETRQLKDAIDEIRRNYKLKTAY